MRVAFIPESFPERIALLAGVVPIPVCDSFFPFLLARAIMVGTRIGVFEALAAGALTSVEIAARTNTDPRGMEKLLNALVGCRYLSLDDGRYALTPMARKWLLADSPHSCRDKILFQFIEWTWAEHAEEYVRTGKPMDVHSRFSEEEWGIYQRGMRSAIEPMVKELVTRLKLPKGATRMLDVGGSHGYYSVGFCRSHPRLSSEVLDLPDAIRHAEPILAKEKMGSRVIHRPGDVLKDDLGLEQYDFVLVASLVHHFDDATNRAMMKRIARALKPGGVVAIFEGLRLDKSGTMGQLGGLMDLFFATASRSGLWSPPEMADWQREAGLVPRNILRLRVANLGAQVADKPR